MAHCQFLASKTNLVIISPPGVGKTHLAIEFGREACRRGHVYLSSVNETTPGTGLSSWRTALIPSQT